jgi:hypothetical protein
LAMAAIRDSLRFCGTASMGRVSFLRTYI